MQVRCEAGREDRAGMAGWARMRGRWERMWDRGCGVFLRGVGGKEVDKYRCSFRFLGLLYCVF